MRGATLLALARSALVESTGGPQVVISSDPWLSEPGACFVTLRKSGELRGCIGSVEPRRALGVDVVENAKAAAYSDPRFPPFRKAELPATRVAVTLLSPIEPTEAKSQGEAISLLRPGVDGVVLQWGGRRAVFIPKVWEKLPEPSRVLVALQHKAGWPGGWMPGMTLSRFTAEDWAEPD
jgi:hypothetical protein